MSLLRRYVLTNLPLKALSLGAALVLWALIAAEPDLETTLNVPVEYHNMPSDLEMVQDQVPNVHLQVRGPSRKVRSTDRGETAVVLDLAPIRHAGETTFTLDRSQIVLPAGVTFVKAVPSQLRLNFERRASRAILVQPRFTGANPDGYEVGSYRVEPQALMVVGPESRLDLLDYITTDAIDISQLRSDRSFTRNAFLADPHLRFENEESVRVDVHLKKR